MIKFSTMDSNKFYESARAVDNGKPVEVHDQEYPLPLDLQYVRHIVGLSASTTALQVIMNDGSRSRFDHSNPAFQTDFKDKLIPDNAVIGEVEVMYHKMTSCVYGIKFMGDDGRCLLSNGYISTPSYRNGDEYAIIKVVL